MRQFFHLRVALALTLLFTLACMGCDESDTGSSGDELGNACGTSEYGGPYYDDYQVESQCEALYAYECSEEAVETICETLDQWENNGVPNVCPYC